MSSPDSCNYDISSLRRCGRAFTGERALVEEALRKLLVDLDIAAKSRVDLYREFLATLYWRVWSTGTEQDVIFATPAAQAHWLTMVENFSCCEAAEVLNISEGELESLLRAYQAENSRDRAKQVLIVEDEFFITHELKSIVRRMGHEIFGTASTKEAALAQCRERKPDLVLADILLKDGTSGLDVCSELSSKFETPAVFITAYREFLKSEAPSEPLFVIDKPYEPAAVVATVRQALYFAEKRAAKAGIEAVH